MRPEAHCRDIRAIKADAKRDFGWIPGVLGIGIGRNSLRIYIHDSNVQNKLPKNFEGVQLDFVVTGDISPA